MVRCPRGQPGKPVRAVMLVLRLSNCDHGGRTLDPGGFRIQRDAYDVFYNHSDTPATPACRHLVPDYGDIPICNGLDSPGQNTGIPGFARRCLICADRTGERLPCCFSRLANRDIRRTDLDRGRNLKLPLQGYRRLALWRIQEHRKRPVAFPVCAGRRHTQRLAPQRTGAEQSENSPNHEAFCSGSEATA